jgi:hypothetical protein
MEITLKFERAILLDECFKWEELNENEALIGTLNGRTVITQYITDEQYASIWKQAKEKSKKRVSE